MSKLDAVNQAIDRLADDVSIWVGDPNSPRMNKVKSEFASLMLLPQKKKKRNPRKRRM